VEIEFNVATLFDDNLDLDKGTDLIINRGGAGSGKSHALIQVLLKRGLENKGIKILVLRKVGASLKKSVEMQFLQYLKDVGIFDERNWSIVYKKYILPNGTEIHFAGLDDRQKLKSSEWNIIWLEEANEFSRADYNFIRTRKYRGDKYPDLKAVIYMSFNPEQCWIEGIEGKKGVKVIHSTYKDNPFVNQEYKDTLESLKDEDLALYSIFALGLYSRPENMVYRPLIVLKNYPDRYNQEIYWVDFGFNNPSAVGHIGEKDQEFYLTELLYQTKLTNGDLIDMFKEMKLDKTFPMYCDSAEPNRIEEIRRAGYNAFPSDKSVKDGIDFVKRKKIYTLDSNIHINKEWAGYSYKKDKQGNVTDEPVKFNDHNPDGIRYAIFTHYKDKDRASIREILKENESTPNSLASQSDW